MLSVTSAAWIFTLNDLPPGRPVPVIVLKEPLTELPVTTWKVLLAAGTKPFSVLRASVPFRETVPETARRSKPVPGVVPPTSMASVPAALCV
jgi:hypothetical protein